MSDIDSDTIWVQRLKQGDHAAAQPLWDRYFARLLGLARFKLGTSNRRAADEQDVAISAFNSFCCGVAANKFSELKDRQDLWQVLSMLTVRKAWRQMKRENALKRGGGRVHGESVLQQGSSLAAGGIDLVPDDNETPEFLAIMEEEFRCLLERLPEDELRGIALDKLEGHTNAEIAKRIGRHERSVERKLAIIRECWRAQSEDEGDK